MALDVYLHQSTVVARPLPLDLTPMDDCPSDMVAKYVTNRDLYNLQQGHHHPAAQNPMSPTPSIHSAPGAAPSRTPRNPQPPLSEPCGTSQQFTASSPAAQTDSLHRCRSLQQHDTKLPPKSIRRAERRALQEAPVCASENYGALLFSANVAPDPQCAFQPRDDFGTGDRRFGLSLAPPSLSH